MRHIISCCMTFQVSYQRYKRVEKVGFLFRSFRVYVSLKSNIQQICFKTNTL